MESMYSLIGDTQTWIFNTNSLLLILILFQKNKDVHSERKKRTKNKDVWF